MGWYLSRALGVTISHRVTTSPPPPHPLTTSTLSDMSFVFTSARPTLFGSVALIPRTGALCALLMSTDFHWWFSQENVPTAAPRPPSTASLKFLVAHIYTPSLSFRHHTVLRFKLPYLRNSENAKSRSHKNSGQKGGWDPGHDNDGDGRLRWYEIAPHEFCDWEKGSPSRGVCSTVCSLTRLFFPPFSHFFLA